MKKNNKNEEERAEGKAVMEYTGEPSQAVAKLPGRGGEHTGRRSLGWQNFSLLVPNICLSTLLWSGPAISACHSEILFF